MLLRWPWRLQEISFAFRVEIAGEDFSPGLAKFRDPVRVSRPELPFQLLPDLLREGRALPRS